MPEMKVHGKPVLQVQRGPLDKVRLVARFHGPVLLKRETIPQVTFALWYTQEGWALIDTDLTPERKRFCRRRAQREEMNSLMSRTRLLDIFEHA